MIKNIENNIIAKFMDFNKTNNGYFPSKKYKYLDYDSFYSGNSSRLKFHLSWEWIMLVVEKIETMEYPNTRYSNQIEVSIEKNACYITYEGYHSGTIIHTTKNNKFDAVYDAVLKFIKWYNNLPN